MSDDATVKTCPNGCHKHENGRWLAAWLVSGAPEDPSKWPPLYCFPSRAELLPGGAIVRMVPLKTAMDEPKEATDAKTD